MQRLAMEPAAKHNLESITIEMWSYSAAVRPALVPNRRSM